MPGYRIDMYAEFRLRPFIGVDPMDEDKPPVLRVILSHEPCDTYSCAFPAPPYRLTVAEVEREMADHMERTHPNA